MINTEPSFRIERFLTDGNESDSNGSSKGKKKDSRNLNTSEAVSKAKQLLRKKKQTEYWIGLILVASPQAVVLSPAVLCLWTAVLKY